MKYALEYGLLTLLGIYAILPTQAASAMGGAIFRAIGPHMGISKVARRNIAAAFPNWDQTQIEQTLTDMWDNLGRIIAEYPHLEDIARNRTTFVNGVVFHQGRATLYVSGHIANWEILPAALLFQQDIVMHSAYRAPNNPYVDALVVKYRAFGGRLRSFGKHRKGLAGIMQALQGGENVGMLIDQKMNTGIEAAFFGRVAMTSTAFVELSRKLGCPLVPGRIVRLPGCRFIMEGFPPIAVGDRPTEDIVADMHQVLENWITEHPGQWLWLHRRWKNP